MTSAHQNLTDGPPVPLNASLGGAGARRDLREMIRVPVALPVALARKGSCCGTPPIGQAHGQMAEDQSVGLDGAETAIGGRGVRDELGPRGHPIDRKCALGVVYKRDGTPFCYR